MKRLFLGLTLLTSSYSFAACLPDVAQSFANLKDKVTPLSVWTDNQFAKNTYRQLLKTKWGLNTHIQGVVRIPGTSKFAITGGDFYSKEAALFMVDFSSQDGQDELQKNFPGKKVKKSSHDDRFILNKKIGSSKFWHAGGISILENIVAIPVEDNKETRTSEILFFDVSDASAPRQLEIKIERKLPSGSVVFFRDENQKIIVGATSDGVFEFYQSKTTLLEDGFETQGIKLQTEAKGQGSQILQQCDGKKFLIDFDNTSAIPPIIFGKNFARLFSMEDKTFELKLIAQKNLETQKFCNFKASGSAHILESGKLAVYGTHFYRHNRGKTFKLCQFSE